MQKVFVFVITAIIAFGCASSKKAVDISIGTWDHVVKDTPYGDVEGYMIIAKEGENYTGSLNSDQGSIPIENLTIEDGNLKGTFYVEGMELSMSGTFEGTSYDGKVTVDYNDFTMTATKRELQ